MCKPSPRHAHVQGRAAFWLAGCLGLLVASCGGGPTSEATNPDPVEGSAAESPVAVEPAAESELFTAPTVPPVPAAASAARPLPPGQLATGLISATTGPNRLPQVSVGRTDPFASLPAAPVIIRQPAIPPVPPEERPAVSEAAPAPAMPALPALVPVPAAPPEVSVAAAPVGVAVPATPTVSVPQSIQIMGALEMGGRYSIIVEVPGEGSRYASVGDRLAGGTVLIKRVEMTGQEPRVILEHNGQEIVRTVGDRSTLVSAR
ncbi:MAG: hypothetical protein D6742_20075 [Cyanobacteria bacterium J069]|nr:MAG: hypothetical protein D6742_20075 [Cyanobacteria bacterium J069]